MFEFTTSDRARFDAFVAPVPEAGCWLWTGPAHRSGYGRFQINGRPQRAHRVSFAMAKGAIPQGMGVCHKCDTPACVNPDHLFLGDQAANIRDAYAKGRVTTTAASRVPRGSRKLTDEQVQSVLASSERQSVLAARFNVDKSVIRLIRRRQTYQWVQAVAA